MSIHSIDWRNNPKSRTILYAGRRLNPFRTVTISGEKHYLSTFAGQCAALTCANLLSRMTSRIALALPDIAMHPKLVWLGGSLREAIQAQLLEVGVRPLLRPRDDNPGDWVFSLGGTRGDIITKGSGWIAYAGPDSAPSLLDHADSNNPMGAVLSVILGGAQLFLGDFPRTVEAQLVDGFNWRENPTGHTGQFSTPSLRRLMTVGAGSVGSSAMYFLTMFAANFSAELIDHDSVEKENLDRSPIFSLNDYKQDTKKAHSVEKFILRSGRNDVHTETNALHESVMWAERKAGQPDALIAAANEMDVRRHVEEAFPPLQIYATTGMNWQTTLIRHIPLIESCSSCLFPSKLEPKETACASAPCDSSAPVEKPQIDASVPFLSFAAGLMTAMEFFKVPLSGYPFYTQRVSLCFYPSFGIVHLDIPLRPGCLCQDRNSSTHHAIIDGSLYSQLSKKGPVQRTLSKRLAG